MGINGPSSGAISGRWANLHDGGVADDSVATIHLTNPGKVYRTIGILWTLGHWLPEECNFCNAGKVRTGENRRNSLTNYTGPHAHKPKIPAKGCTEALSCTEVPAESTFFRKRPRQPPYKSIQKTEEGKKQSFGAGLTTGEETESVRVSDAVSGHVPKAAVQLRWESR